MWSKLLAVGLSLLLLCLLLQSCVGERCDCVSWNDVEVSWYDPTTGQFNTWTGDCGDSLSLTVCQGNNICINSSVNCNCVSFYAWEVTGPQAYYSYGPNLPCCFEPPEAGSYLLELHGECISDPGGASECPICTLNLSVNLSPELGGDFILVGTDNSSDDGKGKVLLYSFDSSANPIFATTPVVAADFAGGVVQGLDIFDYDGDADLDFIALVGLQPDTDWEFELFLFRNDGCFQFTKIPITSELPPSSYAGLADCTAADFDYPCDERVDFIVAIGFLASPTKIFKFQNTGDINDPFEQLETTITENWADHAAKMDSADFNRDGLGDFTTFDYQVPAEFHDDVVIYQRGNTAFGSSDDFPAFYYVTPHPLGTPSSISAITAGQFTDGYWPDVIVGGDDDGDSGQYWLYANTGSNFTGTPVEVFDLNPYTESKGHSQPGGGKADAYDFNADGMMDVVAFADRMAGNITKATTGEVTIWYIERTGSGSFAAQWAGGGLPIAPSCIIDIIIKDEHGRAASIAAPPTTSFGVG